MRTSIVEQFPHPVVPWISWELADVGDDWAVLAAAIMVMVRAVVPADAVVWNGFDLSTGWATVVGDPPELYCMEVAELTRDLDDHPMKAAFLSGSPAVSSAPVRISDLTSERCFRRTRTWAELFQPLGVAHQLTTPTGGNLRTAGVGWSLNREHVDFTDDEVALMRTLQPVLCALEQPSRWVPAPAACEARESLTARELQVLALVADGLTAQAIGHRLRISPATVRKHLEHIYEKTGCRDRLLAVQYAQRHGLLSRRD
jgi:DNA-binding CsgD family transcriptional regulator